MRRLTAVGIVIFPALICQFSSVVFGQVYIRTYQVISEADDGFATEPTQQSIYDPYLAVGDVRVYTPPFQISAMRFVNIDIPRSAEIVDARLTIRSVDSNYRGQIYGIINTEAVDDAPDFSARSG